MDLAGDGIFEQTGLGDDDFLAAVLEEVDGGFDLGDPCYGGGIWLFGEIYLGFGDGGGYRGGGGLS